MSIQHDSKSTLRGYNSPLEALRRLRVYLSTALNDLFKNKPNEEAKLNNKYGNKTREQWWEDRFEKHPVIYNAQDKCPRDVRNFIFDRSYILEDIVDRYNLKGNSDEETALRCLVFIQDHIKYVSDETARKQIEFWQYPEDTVTRGTGDCEDMSILLKSLTLCADVPDWKVRILAGKVKGGGHAYCTFVREDDSQCILDCCYWPNKLPINKRPAIENEPNYYVVWFSFTKKYSYANGNIVYDKGKVKK